MLGRDYNPHESKYLLADDTEFHHAGKKNRFSAIASISAVGLILFVTIIGYAQYSTSSSRSHEKQQQSSLVVQSSAESEPRNAVSIRVENEYSNQPGAPAMFPYPFLSGDVHLMEPYRESTVITEGLSPECGVNWYLERYSDAERIVEGYSETVSEFLVKAKSTGKFRFKLMQQCTSKNFEFLVYVRYVRRELRTLTDRDREEFLDALYVLGTTSTEEGKKLYGDRYKSQAYLSVIHLDGQDNGFCDQFHRGPGYLASHMFLEAYLEQSLQLVNPRTCLHYWEFGSTFTSDEFAAHMSNQLDGGAYTEIMSEKWFGRNDPFTGRILDGRWKNFKLPLMNDQFFLEEGINKNQNFFPENDAEYKSANTLMHATSPFGYLRSVSNYNPNPYLARYNNFERISDAANLIDYAPSSVGVSCDTIAATILNYIDQPIANITKAMGNSHPHYSAHGKPGGVGGEKSATNDAILKEQFNFSDIMIVETTNAVIDLRHTDHSYTRQQTIYFDCSNEPFDYSTGVQKFVTPPGDPGSVQCPFHSSYFESEEGVNKLFNALFSNKKSAVLNVVRSYDFQKKVELLKILGDRFTYAGEMTSSSAVTDPLFWVIHGSFERILQLLHFEHAMASEQFDHFDNCAGHNADSPKSWLTGYYFQDEAVDAGELTLRELQNALNPLTPDFERLQKYIYDSAEWSYCPSLLPKFRSALGKLRS